MTAPRPCAPARTVTTQLRAGVRRVLKDFNDAGIKRPDSSPWKRSIGWRAGVLALCARTSAEIDTWDIDDLEHVASLGSSAWAYWNACARMQGLRDGAVPKAIADGSLVLLTPTQLFAPVPVGVPTRAPHLRLILGGSIA